MNKYVIEIIGKMKYKICVKCKERKSVGEFYKHKTNKDGLNGQCKSCVIEWQKRWAKANPEKIHKWRKINTEKRRITKKRYRKNNPEVRRKEKKRYYKANREKVMSYLRKYKKRRKIKDTVFKLKHDLNKAIKKSLNNRGCAKKSKTIDMLGINIDEFYKWLDGEASNGLHVDKGNFHLDHVVPISLAENENEVKLLSHYSNFQLLSPKNNLLKKNNYIYEINLNRVLEYHPNPSVIQNIVDRSNVEII